MGRGRGKGRKHALALTREDHGSGEEEKVPTYKRRGRPQKTLKDDIVEEAENVDEDVENVNGMKSQTGTENGSKRRRSAQVKESMDSVEEENNGNGTIVSAEDKTKSVGFRLVGSRRKNKPRRAAEVGVEC